MTPRPKKICPDRPVNNPDQDFPGLGVIFEFLESAALGAHLERAVNRVSQINHAQSLSHGDASTREGHHDHAG
jgi:hypothetical protein